MDTSLTAALSLGLLLGLRHAMDADHVVAVSTLVSRHRSVVHSCVLGAFWGAGHTAALLASGVAIIVFRLAISPEVEKGLEMAVAGLLILLGSHALLRSIGTWTLHSHAHTHDDHLHRHVHLHVGADESPGHVHMLKVGGRPFLVGIVHGLAGSAALMLLVLTTIPSSAGALLYILVFGVGSTGGMLLLSGLIGIPFTVAAGRSATAHATIQTVAGAASLILGLVLAWQLGRA